MLSDALLTALASIVLLGTVIWFHEFGHFIAAKLVGMRVEELAFGFGPKLIRLFRRGETEYTIHPIPIGGFTKIAGMEHGDENIPDGFRSKPRWARFFVYFSGPFMSLLLACLVFSALGLTVGLPITRDVVNRVDLVEPGSEAERAGLKTGDVIVSINGERIDSGMEMLTTIHGSANKRLTIVISREERLITIRATPKPRELEKGKVVGVLGFMPVQRLQRVGLAESVRFGVGATVGFVEAVVGAIFSRQVKDVVGGPLAIVDAAQTSVKRGANGFLQLVGILSLSLGIINLIPIPVVDGGQMVILVIEGVRRRSFSARTVEITTRVGWTIIMMILILMIYLDLTRVASNKLFR